VVKTPHPKLSFVILLPSCTIQRAFLRIKRGRKKEAHLQWNWNSIHMLASSVAFFYFQDHGLGQTVHGEQKTFKSYEHGWHGLFFLSFLYWDWVGGGEIQP